MAHPINMALYRVLVKHNLATEAEAEQAAALDATDLATRADLFAVKTELQATILALEARLAWKVVGAMVGLAGIFALIVGWMNRAA